MKDDLPVRDGFSGGKRFIDELLERVGENSMELP